MAFECVTYVASVTDTPGFDRSLPDICLSPGVKTPGYKIGRADGTFVPSINLAVTLSMIPVP